MNLPVWTTVITMQIITVAWIRDLDFIRVKFRESNLIFNKPIKNFSLKTEIER